MSPDDLSVVVLTTGKRKNYATSVLNFPHRIYLNKDWEYPKDQSNFHPFHNQACGSPKTLVYNVFRGHQECLKLTTKPFVLMLEDDAKPCPDWFEKLDKISCMLGEYDLIQLFSSDYESDKRFNCGGFNFHTLKQKNGFKWSTGAVAYFTSRKIALKLSEEEYIGIAFDNHMNHFYNAVVLDKNNFIFGHDGEFGSHFGGGLKF